MTKIIFTVVSLKTELKSEREAHQIAMKKNDQNLLFKTENLFNKK